MCGSLSQNKLSKSKNLIASNTASNTETHSIILTTSLNQACSKSQRRQQPVKHVSRSKYTTVQFSLGFNFGSMW